MDARGNVSELLHEYNSVLNNVACSIGGLKSALDAFGLLANKIENRISELRDLECEVIQRQAELDGREERVKAKEAELVQREKVVVSRKNEANQSKSHVGGQRLRKDKPPIGVSRTSLSTPLSLLEMNSDESCKTPVEALVAVKTWLPHTHFSLIYKASRDGFSSKSFHRVCDNNGPTLTVIRSYEGYIFGGYSPCSWNTSGAYFSHPQAFLFTLTNPHAIPPTRFPLRSHDPLAIRCRPDRCAVFGGGYDVCVGSDSDKRARNSYANFPCSFVDPYGLGNVTFTGSRHFMTQEVEVYACAWFE